MAFTSKDKPSSSFLLDLSIPRTINGIPSTRFIDSHQQNYNFGTATDICLHGWGT